MIFLRLRKAWRKMKLPVLTVGSHLSRGSRKLGATLVPTAPGDEAASLVRLAEQGTIDEDTVILVGERAATAPGALATVIDLCRTRDARMAWVPRRAGEVGAVEAGCLPTLLPGGRPVTDVKARVDVAAAWGVESLPDQPGRTTPQILDGLADGTVEAVMVSGVQLSDLPDPQAARQAFDTAGFVVSLEQRCSEVTERADVVFPVCLLEETSGTFLDWEHRPGRVRVVNKQPRTPMNEIRVLAALADAMGTPLGMRTVSQAHQAWLELGDWEGRGQSESTVVAPPAPERHGGLVLDTWRELLDDSACLDGSQALRQTARPLVARVSPRTACDHDLASTDVVNVTLAAGDSVEVPVSIDESMIDGVVWVPAHCGTGSAPARAGQSVQINKVHGDKGGVA